jgi:micrococcal nuclease
VIHILDSDTIDILTADKATVRVRMHGIDAPERGQPFGERAKEFLSDDIGGKIVRVVTHGKDRYGRTIGYVYCMDCFSMASVSTVNVGMVTNGLAWHFVKYAPDDKELAGAEKWAREQRLRLRSDRRSIPPLEWLKMSKAERDKLR